MLVDDEYEVVSIMFIIYKSKKSFLINVIRTSVTPGLLNNWKDVALIDKGCIKASYDLKFKLRKSKMENTKFLGDYKSRIVHPLEIVHNARGDKMGN